MRKIGILAVILCLPILASANEFETWLDSQFTTSKRLLRANISRGDTRPGVVVASPSQNDPNYFYHWVRDASLVFLTVHRLYNSNHVTDAQRKDYKNLLGEYLDITKVHQAQNSIGGIGEVKYFVDGSAFQGPWGRPQNDGPALRALSLIRYANDLIADGKIDFVKRELYDGKVPSKTVIKKDLEYVSHQWRNHDFDLWEEVKGHHFFTRLGQRRALLEGADLAQRLGDGGAATWYRQQAAQLTSDLHSHWDRHRGFFKSTINRVGGIDYKSGLDSSTVLGIIYTEVDGDSNFDVVDHRMASNVEKIRQSFRFGNSSYHINHVFNQFRAGIGRYPEDQYDGHRTGSTGNPWFLTTAGIASYHYRLARKVKAAVNYHVSSVNQGFVQEVLGGKIAAGNIIRGAQKKQFVDQLIANGDSYLKRMKFHMGRDGTMKEQFNRDHGVMQGAADLTWSYSSFINAYLSRKEALR